MKYTEFPEDINAHNENSENDDEFIKKKVFY